MSIFTPLLLELCQSQTQRPNKDPDNLGANLCQDTRFHLHWHARYRQNAVWSVFSVVRSFSLSWYHLFYYWSSIVSPYRFIDWCSFPGVLILNNHISDQQSQLLVYSYSNLQVINSSGMKGRRTWPGTMSIRLSPGTVSLSGETTPFLPDKTLWSMSQFATLLSWVNRRQ